MRILLDENFDWRLGGDLPGHQIESVPLIGWAGIQNGELLAKAAETDRLWKLDCFKHSSSKQTRSRLKSESYRGRGDLRLIRQLTSGSCSWATFNFKRP